MPSKKHVYLAGAIEAAPDKGTRWRTILTPQLEELGYKIFNPCLETDVSVPAARRSTETRDSSPRTPAAPTDDHSRS